MNIYIRKGTNYYEPIRYVLKIIEKNRNIRFSFLSSAEKAQLIWDHENSKSENFNQEFYNQLASDQGLKHDRVFINAPIIRDEKGDRDLITTIFYLVNCLQEIAPEANELDPFGRFKYSSSYQFRFGNIEENTVEQLIDSFCEKHNITGEKYKSKFFISHDIDTIYSSFLQDGFWALKRMKVGVILKLIVFELSRRPHWRNIDKIIKINDEFDIKSTFFWLVNKGKGTHGIKNADYKLHKETDLLKLVERSNNTNGLHKSCSDMSIDAELEKGKLNTTYNRHHFINCQPYADWKKVSDSKLNFDCSLGFAEHYGFRNSYGKAFQPFDIATNKPFDFVEAPLHFIDVTFHKYMKSPTESIGKTIIDFYEKNDKNCDLSLLWHNVYFTDYKYHSFIDEYKKIVSFIYESGIECVTPKELVEKNKLEW